jgi:hypothetical protein
MGGTGGGSAAAVRLSAARSAVSTKPADESEISFERATIERPRMSGSDAIESAENFRRRIGLNSGGFARREFPRATVHGRDFWQRLDCPYFALRMQQTSAAASISPPLQWE